MTHYLDLKMEDLLAFPLQVAELVRKGAEEADSLQQECNDLNNKVEKLIQLPQLGFGMTLKTLG